MNVKLFLILLALIVFASPIFAAPDLAEHRQPTTTG